MSIDLDFSKQSIDDARAVALVAALSEHRSIRVLNLSHNMIGDVGATAVATIISKVSFLYLDDNYISDAGAIAIASAVSRPEAKLKMLSILYNPLGQDGVHAMKAMPVKVHFDFCSSLIKRIREMLSFLNAADGAAGRFLRADGDRAILHRVWHFLIG